MFEYDDDDQFQEVSPGRSAAPLASPVLLADLKTVLRKWKFTKYFLSTRSLFWESYCSFIGENRQVSELSLLSAQLF